jgi:hypothetical protein
MAYKSKIDQANASKRHYRANKKKIKARSRQRNIKQTEINRHYVTQLKTNSQCIDCGEDNPLVLDFDHVRGEKIKCISDMVRGAYSLKTLQNEIDKCEIRCSNCHRIATHKRHHE